MLGPGRAQGRRKRARAARSVSKGCKLRGVSGSRGRRLWHYSNASLARAAAGATAHGVSRAMHGRPLLRAARGVDAPTPTMRFHC